MLKGSAWGKHTVTGSTWGAFFSASFFFCIVVITALLVGGIPNLFGVYSWIVIIGALSMAILLLLRQDALALMIVMVVHLYVDWYLVLHLVGLVMIPLLLVIFFLAQSPRYPWAQPRSLWLWMLFLVLAIEPAIRGALTLYDAMTFYPSNFMGAFLIFWLGAVIARDGVWVRGFFKLFAILGVLVAMHTLIQATTGKVLFESSRVEAFLSTVTYNLNGEAQRAGSFFVDPNWNGTFLAIMIFLPMALFVESSSMMKKVLYLGMTFLMVPALLSTYSSGAWIGVSAGIGAFVILVGNMRYRLLMLTFILVVVISMVVFFPSQVALQLQHATDSNDLILRTAAWQTALQVIRAFPLAGVGLGYQAYLLRADPYRVPAQFEPLEHPHNAYLELAAMAGLPVFFLFLTILLCGLWFAWRNWKIVDAGTRSLIGGGMASVIALSVNSWMINGWTHPVLGMMGWLILGVISSPLLERSHKNEAKLEQTTTDTNKG